MKACEKYGQMMSRHVDGDLTAEESAELMSHMENCAHCSAQFALYQMMCEALSDMEAEPPEGFTQEVLSKIGKDKKKSFFRRYGMGAFVGLAAVAAAFALVVSGNLNMLFMPEQRVGAADTAPMQAQLKSAGSGELTGAAPELSAGTPAPQDNARKDADLQEGASADAAESSTMMTRGLMATVSPDESANSSPAQESPAAQAAGGTETTPEDGADSDSPGVMGIHAALPQAPALPFEGMFALIVKMSGADMAQFSQYEQDIIEEQTYIFIPREELEALLGAQSDESVTYTVYKTGDQIDPEAENGLVIVTE